MSKDVTYTVSTLGFDERERAFLRDVLRLSEHRTPSYRVHARAADQLPHVVIVNAEQAEAVKKWQAFRTHYGNRYTSADVLVGTASENVSSAYRLARPASTAQLFATLDRAVAQAHGFKSAAPVTAAFVLSADECPAPVVVAAVPSAPPEEELAVIMEMSTADELDALLAGVTTTMPAFKPAPAEPPAAIEISVEMPVSSPPEAIAVEAPAAPVDTSIVQKAVSEARLTGAKDRPGPVPASKARILVVDDSLPVRMQMVTALQNLASAVDFAATGEQAMSMLEKSKYDVIFLDVILPGKDGYEVCRYIRRHPTHKKVPVIMLTSNSTPADRVKGKMAGCDTYLVKPVRQSVLTEVIADFITTAPNAA